MIFVYMFAYVENIDRVRDRNVATTRKKEK